MKWSDCGEGLEDVYIGSVHISFCAIIVVPYQRAETKFANEDFCRKVSPPTRLSWERQLLDHVAIYSTEIFPWRNPNSVLAFPTQLRSAFYHNDGLLDFEFDAFSCDSFNIAFFTNRQHNSTEQNDLHQGYCNHSRRKLYLGDFVEASERLQIWGGRGIM